MRKNNNFINTDKKYEDLITDSSLSVATLGGGCFWCLEGPFKELKGVKDVVAGYSGGYIEYPTYEQISTGTTGHREAVQIFYDPQMLSYKEILDIFWYQIDPTDPDGQFSDKGEQYKTAIFYHDEGQKMTAQNSINEIEKSGRYNKPVATQLIKFVNFYPAEDYHQDFYVYNKARYEMYKLLSGRQRYIEKMRHK